MRSQHFCLKFTQGAEEKAAVFQQLFSLAKESIQGGLTGGDRGGGRGKGNRAVSGSPSGGAGGEMGEGSRRTGSREG